MRTLWIAFTLASLFSFVGAASYIIVVWADVGGSGARVISLLVWLAATIAACVFGTIALVSARKIWAIVPYLLMAVIAGQLSLAVLISAAMGPQPLSSLHLLGLLALIHGAGYGGWWLLLRGWSVLVRKGRNAPSPRVEGIS